MNTKLSTYMKANQIIKLKREEHKLSQESMAYELGITQSQYSKRERGELKFRFEEIVKAAKILLIEIEVLVPAHSYKDYTLPHNGRLDPNLIMQYESRLKEKDEMIELLREKLQNGGVIH